MDVDIKMASRVVGVDAILGGHTHDGTPAPTLVENAGGRTLVTNAGSNGKFLLAGASDSAVPKRRDVTGFVGAALFQWVNPSEVQFGSQLHGVCRCVARWSFVLVGLGRSPEAGAGQEGLDRHNGYNKQSDSGAE